MTLYKKERLGVAVRQIYCNCCGKMLQIGQGEQREDCLKVEKEWGYFSAKDRELHTFYVCEACYDAWIRTFQIPVSKENVEEVL